MWILVKSEILVWWIKLRSTIRCKPDLVLVDEDFSTNNVLRGGKPNWREFHAYTEVTHNTTQYRLNRTTWQKSFAMFKSQPTRWFIQNLTFRCHLHCMWLCWWGPYQPTLAWREQKGACAVHSGLLIWPSTRVWPDDEALCRQYHHCHLDFWGTIYCH